MRVAIEVQMGAFLELSRYRAEMLAVWRAQPARLVAAWEALPVQQRQGEAQRALAELWWWETQVGFPNLRALLQGAVPRFVLPQATPAAFPEPQTMLAEYRRLRETAWQMVKDLDAAGWSRLGRHPHFGRRTVQWWVERSLAAGQRALRRLSPEEVPL